MLEMSVVRTVVLSKGKGFSFLFKAAGEGRQGEAAVLPIKECLNCSAEKWLIFQCTNQAFFPTRIFFLFILFISRSCCICLILIYLIPIKRQRIYLFQR